MAEPRAEDSITAAAFVTSSALNAGLFVVIVAAFALLRNRLTFIYFSRWLRIKEHPPTPERSKWKLRDPTVLAELTPSPPAGLCALLSFVFSLPDSHILASVGLDAYVYLRFIKLLTWYFTLITGLFGLAIILPINATSGFPEARASDFDVLSIGNIPQGSARLWAHSVSVWVFTVGMFALVMDSYKHYLPLRYAWLAVPQPSRFSCLLVDLPPTIRTDEDLYHLVNGLFPGQVHTVCMVTRARELDKSVKTRDDVVRRLYRCQLAVSQRERERQGGAGRLQEVKDTLRRLEGKLSQLDEQLWCYRHYGARDVSHAAQTRAALECDEMHATVQGSNRAGEVAHARTRVTGVYKPMNAGFVTFNNLAAAAMAPQVVLSSRNLGMRELALRRAPEPRDVLWKNIGMSRNERRVRLRIAGVLAFALILVYLPLTTAVSTLTSLDTIAQAAPWLADYANTNTLAKAALEGWVPSILLSLILLAIPPLMKLLANYGGSRSRSEASLTVFKYTFAWNVFVSFLVFSVSGTLWASVDAIVQSPLSTATILATSLPKLAAFFAQFILFQGLVATPLSHLRLGPMFLYAFCYCKQKKRWPARTLMDVVELREWASGDFGHDHRLSHMLVVFVIANAYSSINPIISPCAVLYLLIDSWTARFAFLYGSNKQFETGGAMFPVVVNRLLAGMVIYQLTMIGLLGLKEAPGPSAAVFPLPFVTFAFYKWLEDGYHRDSNFLPLDAARNPELLLGISNSPHLRKAVNPQHSVRLLAWMANLFGRKQLTSEHLTRGYERRAAALGATGGRRASLGTGDEDRHIHMAASAGRTRTQESGASDTRLLQNALQSDSASRKGAATTERGEDDFPQGGLGGRATHARLGMSPGAPTGEVEGGYAEEEGQGNVPVPFKRGTAHSLGEAVFVATNDQRDLPVSITRGSGGRGLDEEGEGGGMGTHFDGGIIVALARLGRVRRQALHLCAERARQAVRARAERRAGEAVAEAFREALSGELEEGAEEQQRGIQPQQQDVSASAAAQRAVTASYHAPSTRNVALARLASLARTVERAPREVAGGEQSGLRGVAGFSDRLEARHAQRAASAEPTAVSRLPSAQGASLDVAVETGTHTQDSVAGRLAQPAEGAGSGQSDEYVQVSLGSLGGSGSGLRVQGVDAGFRPGVQHLGRGGALGGGARAVEEEGPDHKGESMIGESSSEGGMDLPGAAVSRGGRLNRGNGPWARHGQQHEDVRRPRRVLTALGEAGEGARVAPQPGPVDETHKWAYLAQRSVFLRPCYRAKFDLPYRPTEG